METKSIAKYSSIEAGLEDLKQRHLDVVVDVTTPQGMKTAKDGRAELRKVRLNLEEARKEEKADSLAYGRLVDSEANRIKAVIEPMEDAYDNAIKKEEQRIEDEKLAKANAERDAALEKVRLEREAYEAKLLEENRKMKAALEAQAEKERLENERIKAEEDKKLAAEKEKFRQERELFEKEKADMAAAKVKMEADKKAAQEKIDQEEKDRLAKIAKEDAEKKEKEAAAAKLAAEQKSKADAIAKAELEKEEAELRSKQAVIDEEARQIKLKKQLRLDGRSMLLVFKDNYGDQEEFKLITNEIMNYFSSSNIEEIA